MFFNNFNFSKPIKWLVLEFNSIAIIGSMMFSTQESFHKLRPGFVNDALGVVGLGIIIFHLFFALEKDVNSEFFDEMNKKVDL